ncbi:MAG: porin [Myxococcaceae bacterium]|nr:porin [Myxococcaceae bacterium]
MVTAARVGIPAGLVTVLLSSLVHAQEPSSPSLEERVLKLEQQLEAERAARSAQSPTAVDAGCPEAVSISEPAAPFAFADFSWLPGNAGSSERPFTAGPFTGELRVDTAYHHSFANPKDHTISGSSEVFRSGEFQVTQLGFGGDFYYRGAMARLMTQFGLYSVTTPRNDASTGNGQWRLEDAFRYVSEAYGGYHFDVLHGVNVQAGIFMSYVGLWSYYNFDNWTYQPSYVSSNTPWFFNGVRVQIFPTERLKIEPWVVNGWQSYGKFNQAPGVGLQINWRPNGWFSILGNQYIGTDTLGLPDRKRVHSDDSVMVKYHDDPEGLVSRAAVSLTLDAGCEWGGGVSCGDQFFLGFMAYHRLWFLRNTVGLTVGGGAITNPGRYLVLLPPINGATALSGTPYFTYNAGDPYQAWDLQLSADYSPVPFATFRVEFNHRAASVPYFTGPNGVTPPGGNQGVPGSMVDGWSPDLVKSEDRLTAALMIRI